jgi:FkbM family methyltransferase
MKVNLGEFKFEVKGDKQFWPNVQEWEPETFEIVKHYADPKKTFIDIGAWNGVVSLYASGLFKEVIAIEPDVIAFDKLFKNVQANNLKNVFCRNVAISNTNGSSILNLSNAGDSMSSLLPRDTEQFPTVDFQGVETKTFETLISGFDFQIGFIKMDIEGGEVLVIPDMINFLKEHKTPIYISFHPFWFDQEIKGHSILWLAFALFEVYSVVRDAQFNQVNMDEFIEGMHANSFSYLFDTK